MTTATTDSELSILLVDGSACTSVDVTSISNKKVKCIYDNVEYIIYLRNEYLFNTYLCIILCKSNDRNALRV